MFKLNKLFGVAVICTTAAATIAALSSSAAAGLDIIEQSGKSSKEPVGKTKPTRVESMARIPVKKPANTFKCWQEGRLIFQRTNLDINKKQKLPGAAIIRADGKTVQVLDLKQGMCILDQEAK